MDKNDFGTFYNNNKPLLNAREQQVITRRLGMEGHNPSTLQEVGDHLEPPVSRERVRQLEQGAFLKLGKGDSNFAKNIYKTFKHQVAKVEVYKHMEQLVELRMEQRLSFKKCAEIIGVPYTDIYFKSARLKFQKSYGPVELLNKRDKEMVEYKAVHPRTTQFSLAKKFNVPATYVSRKFKRLGIKWAYSTYDGRLNGKSEGKEGKEGREGFNKELAGGIGNNY